MLTFTNEGSQLRYSEMMDVMKGIIKNRLLDHLEEQEIKNFFVKLFTWNLNKFEEQVKLSGYTVRDEYEVFDVSEQIKLVHNSAVWHQATNFVHRIKENTYIATEEIIELLTQDLFEEMKMNEKIMVKREQQLLEDEICLEE